MLILLLFLILIAGSADSAEAQSHILLDQMVHLRTGDEPEWHTFPIETDGATWMFSFQGESNEDIYTLRLRQQDVKQTWKVTLNTVELGELVVDENDMVHYLAVPPGALISGENTLRVNQANTIVDDIRVGEFTLIAQSRDAVLSEASVSLTVRDRDAGTLLPARFTILNEDEALQMVGATSKDQLAVRPGIVYTGNGQAIFGLPAGSYTIYAGRGFEYGIDSVRIEIATGERLEHDLHIGREVPTVGYVSTDTHVHTWTHSGHGDATIEERMITLAAEGIELPIATDHNVFIDYDNIATRMNLRSYFTPVIGNEVTTSVGHFNVFPAETDAPVPNHRLTKWDSLFHTIYETPGVRAAILNHGRDLHSNFLPLGPIRHHAVVGANVDGWSFQANAMEVINSSAQQSDIMQLFHDWFGLLNRGYQVTPVGSSDSHDVGRHFVGQGRTYIRVADDDVGHINVNAAVESFVEGRVNVSLGLLTEITVNEEYGPGELVPASDEITVSVRVLGPGWTKAERVDLYANGRRISTAHILDGARAGIKWTGTWRLPRFPQDVYLVAIAQGPGVQALYWPIAKPYKPDGPIWTPRLIGATGAVRIDVDGDGAWSSAYDIAHQLIAAGNGNLTLIFERLSRYDESVAAQVASLLAKTGRVPGDPELASFLLQATPSTQAGFKAFVDAYSASQSGR